MRNYVLYSKWDGNMWKVLEKYVEFFNGKSIEYIFYISVKFSAKLDAISRREAACTFI